MGKHERLRALSTKRRADRWPGHACIGDYHDGAYECEFVSPYTKSAGNVDSPILVLLQDWSSDERLRGPLDADAQRRGLTPTLPANRRLNELLRRHFGRKLAEVFATNLFPFIKKGGLSATIPFEDLVRAAHEYALPQIEIVEPRLVVCLGKATFNAIRIACGGRRARNMEEAISSPFAREACLVWAQAHTGSLGQNNRNRGGVNRVEQDWRRMRRDFDHIAGSSLAV
jgi:restriction system protein